MMKNPFPDKCPCCGNDSVPRKFYDDLFADWQHIRIAANGESGHLHAEIQELQDRLRDTLVELDASRAAAPPSLDALKSTEKSLTERDADVLLDEFANAVYLHNAGPKEAVANCEICGRVRRRLKTILMGVSDV